MDTAKLFANGRSQAVRLPKEYAFAGEEVYIKRIGGIAMVTVLRDLSGSTTLNLLFTISLLTKLLTLVL